MNIKKLLILFILTALAFSAGFVFMGKSESEIAGCINSILDSSKDHSLYIETKNRGDSPLLKGKAQKKNKEAIINLIQQKCGALNLQDLVDDDSHTQINTPSLSFEMDNVNYIIEINGLVKSKKEADNIIVSFDNAFNDKQQTYTIKHDIRSDRAIAKSELDVFVTLLIPSITNVQLAQISIKNNQLIINGLVRDSTREQQTIDQLTALFAEDLQIINQLELVVKHEPIIEEFKFKLTPLPTIEEQ